MKVLIITAYQARVPGGGLGKYHLTASQDVGPATLRNCAKLGFRIASRSEVKDSLLNSPFGSIEAARRRALRHRFRAYAVQEITARAKRERK